MAHQLTRRGQDRPEPALRSASLVVSDIGPHYLIHGKLKPPQSATICIERGALLSRLDAAARHKLTLLTAPIGSGKTTLLAQWHERSCASHAVAWLSLDEQDNEPVRFFSYLIATVKSVCPAFDAYLPHQRREDESLDAAIAVFVASLGRLNEPACIILDDLQMLSTPVLARAIDALLLQSPAGVRWILSGRGVPSLHMGQLRLNDQLMTLGSEDLNFDTDAIVQLGEQLCHRSLTNDETSSIRRSTEGWVAGVKLALLAAAESRDAIGDFNGSHYEVARYLGTSVLQEQAPLLREFLIASSVVDRMTAELCNALLGIAHSQSLRATRTLAAVHPAAGQSWALVQISHVVSGFSAQPLAT